MERILKESITVTKNLVGCYSKKKHNSAKFFSGNRAELIPFFFGKDNVKRFEKCNYDVSFNLNDIPQIIPDTAKQ
ncbi:MAG: hypothetical protein LBF88_02515 [Planctomycetaceae bacterium]|jgi:hypothetical protein|nr:hypothetical protein [Planctomycetaceae bacterium]